MKPFVLGFLLLVVYCASGIQAAAILTPPPPPTPRINGPRVYGERPGRPFVYTIPATGDEPITLSARGLPEGLSLDSKTGHISGVVTRPGDYAVTLTATNALSHDTRTLKIRIGDQICLTPPMGWNSWNCFAGAVDQKKVAAQAEAMARSGLIKHGWTYINIDDTWQGDRGGKYNALQGNHKFPDMKALCDQIHSLGLKAGIYSTPWVTSYAGYPGGSADNPQGKWSKFKGNKRVNQKILPYAPGPYPFAKQDARQWADWGFDYLKYDWNPIEVPQVEEMQNALLASGRDFVYSLSNSTPFSGVANWAKLANCWRTTGDIRDTWQSMSHNGFSQEKWAPFAGPGHWNDPDMLVVGQVGWGPRLHPTGLTPDEQYTHITLWCMLASPLLIGCDMTRLDDFTLGLLTNDEVLAVDQDELGQEARPINRDATTCGEIWARPLADGTMAVAFFNRGRYELIPPRRARRGQPAPEQVWRVLDRSTNQSTTFNSESEAKDKLKDASGPIEVTLNLSDLHLSGRQTVRDLWRQKDLAPAEGKLSAAVPYHGAVMLKIGTPREPQ